MATRTEIRRESTKRQIMGVLEDTTNMVDGHDKIEGTDSTKVRRLMEDLEKGLQRQLEATKVDVVTWKEEQLQAHKTGLIKINKNIRNMTVAEFNRVYNCNILRTLESVRANATKKIPAHTCGKRDRLGMETPAPYRGTRPMRTPATVVRTVRRGEMLYSQNNSPVEPVEDGALVATVTKKRRGNVAPGASFDINVGEGRYISLNDPHGIHNLDDNMKTNALSQLKVLQDQMASLMEQLTTKESN